jgi:hypothetical protein
MRGEDKGTGELFSYVDLEKRVRSDHPLRGGQAGEDEVPWSRPRRVGLHLRCRRLQSGSIAESIVGQIDDDGVFIDASELRRVIIGIAEDWMEETFRLRTARRCSRHSSSDIHCVR